MACEMCIRDSPETLEPQKEVKEVVQTVSPQGAIPEGTVLGDGHIKFVLALSLIHIFLQDYVSVYLPQDGQWNLMADCIEFDIKPYYQEEKIKYEGKMAGELHLKVTSMNNNKNEVLLNQKIPLSEKRLLKLSRKIKNKEEIVFDIETIIDEMCIRDSLKDLIIIFIM